ncbi:G-protein coupled receptor [Biomphalaria pfeifferi]|uniref:G-protein coupled receptor n=1 Tax=Biomphalaria pfeifferi TaxID=112525 RepID=A0AAD8B0H6_BIOPF|nr:G-protein coupled receptor [Biomphalaria pfeifferi]
MQYLNINGTYVLFNDVTTPLVIIATKPQVPLRANPNWFCFLGSQDYLFPFMVLNCFVNPVLSFLGLFVNGLCLIVLAKGGFRKPSYILLFALVLADSMNMFISLDFPSRIRYFGPVKTKPGYCTFEYDAIMNQYLFVSQEFFNFVGLWGRTINATIPMIITMERILAVYFPVTFTRVVTPKSITASCCASYVIWLPHIIVQSFYRRLLYVQLSNGKVVAITTATEFLFNNFSILYSFTAYFLEAMTSWVPVCFVCLGCILIGIKVSVSISQRRKLTSLRKEQQWSPRTTRTLLTTCLIFAVTHAINALIGTLVTIDNKTPLLTYLLVEIAEFLNILNCTSNFLVYFFLNKKLWRVLLQIIRRRKLL